MCHIIDMVLILEEEDTVDDGYERQRLYMKINDGYRSDAR